jgi:type I restriction enzyme S subunit
MTWIEKTIGDLGQVVTGKTPSTKNSDFYGGIFPFVTPTDLDWDSYYVTKTHSTVTDAAKSRHRNQFLPRGTVFFTCIGNTIGKMGIATKECLTNQQINSIIPNNEHDPKFVYYLLRHYVGLVRSVGLGGGSAQPIINKTDFSRLKVKVASDISVQQKIGATLSNYDDLIQNNRRRIALLEQSARLLYREWFVRKGIIDWPETRIDMLVKRVSAGKVYSQKTVETEGKIPVLDQSYYGIVGYHNDNPSVQASIDSPVLVFANHTCNQRFMFEPFSGIQNVLPFLPNNPEHDIYWLFHATERLVNINAYKGHWPELMAKKIFLPPIEFMKKFGRAVRPIHLQIFVLMRQNSQLTSARDLLLPRLMDGRIAV